nr:hypothetical protein BV190_01189 [Haemophilus influenzae]
MEFGSTCLSSLSTTVERPLTIPTCEKALTLLLASACCFKITVPSPTLSNPLFSPFPSTINVPLPILAKRSDCGLCTFHVTVFPSATETPAPFQVVLSEVPLTS